MINHATKLTTVALVMVLAMASGCSTALKSSASVEGAFLAPNAMVVQPYTRTIFSSNNF